MEKQFTGVIAKEAESAVYKAQQELGVDYLGFGTKLLDMHPDIYNKIDWDRTFPTDKRKRQVYYLERATTPSANHSRSRGSWADTRQTRSPNIPASCFSFFAKTERG
ncbi:MAG: Ger(x)C family spore germination C-terminal domain-containing protein [Firmicutes bacterium]|nr:Ger(x)C family spore germination C-terminal domain-containing protein [Bacillota bacterium]